MNDQIRRYMYAQALGERALSYLETLRPGELDRRVETEAMALIAKIKAVLDDETLDDPTCFFRIEAIVEAFQAAGLPISRHDW